MNTLAAEEFLGRACRQSAAKKLHLADIPESAVDAEAGQVRLRDVAQVAEDAHPAVVVGREPEPVLAGEADRPGHEPLRLGDRDAHDVERVAHAVEVVFEIGADGVAVAERVLQPDAPDVDEKARVGAPPVGQLAEHLHAGQAAVAPVVVDVTLELAGASGDAVERADRSRLAQLPLLLLPLEPLPLFPAGVAGHGTALRDGGPVAP